MRPETGPPPEKANAAALAGARGVQSKLHGKAPVMTRCYPESGGSARPDDARSLTHALNGRWHGSYGTAPCPAHDDRRPSLSLADGHDGRLLARCHAGCEWPAILDALRGLGLVEGRSDGRSPDPAELANRRRKEAADAARRAAQAERCWAEARPIAGTLAERYLRGRGIACPLPNILRFHPTCWHGPTARRHPAMVARVEGSDGPAVHRIYLAPSGGKAPVGPAKMALGATAGGAVRLLGGHRRLVVAEGVETALSLASGLLDGPMSLWAALSAPGMAALRLPPLVDDAELVVACDGDRAGREAAHALAQRADALGWRVSLADPGDALDFNDVLRVEMMA